MYKYWHFEKAVPEDICDKIIEFGKSLEIAEGFIGDQKLDDSIRNSDVSWITEPWIKSIINHYTRVANQNAWNFDLYNDSEISQFTIYKQNNHYSWHVDSDIYVETPRKLSCVLMLSDPSDYSGGDFLLLKDIVEDNTGSFRVEEIKQKGSIIVFPSTLYHKVEPVTSGERLTLVSWTHGPNFK